MKQIILIVSICLAQFSGFSQQSGDMLKEKTEKDLQNIVNSSAAQTGFMAVDLTTGETIGINSDLVFAQASAIKIPILMEVYKQAHEKKFSLSELKVLLPVNTVGGSGILNTMVDPVSLSIRNLCVLMITLSDNSATNTLIDLVGMQAINSTMQTLGFSNTRVQRKMIDAQASRRGDENISTPAEAAKILNLLYQGKFIDKPTSDGILSILKKNGRENSRVVKGLPSGVNIAFKPGGLNGVSTEWSIIFLDGRPYALAVMENFKLPGGSPDVIESISKTLYNYYFLKARASKYGVIMDN